MSRIQTSPEMVQRLRCCRDMKERKERETVDVVEDLTHRRACQKRRSVRRPGESARGAPSSDRIAPVVVPLRSTRPPTVAEPTTMTMPSTSRSVTSMCACSVAYGRGTVCTGSTRVFFERNDNKQVPGAIGEHWNPQTRAKKLLSGSGKRRIFR